MTQCYMQWNHRYQCCPAHYSCEHSGTVYRVVVHLHSRNINVGESVLMIQHPIFYESFLKNEEFKTKKDICQRDRNKRVST